MTPGSPKENRRPGLGTPVFRLMLNLRLKKSVIVAVGIAKGVENKMIK